LCHAVSCVSLLGLVDCIRSCLRVFFCFFILLYANVERGCLYLHCMTKVVAGFQRLNKRGLIDKLGIRFGCLFLIPSVFCCCWLNLQLLHMHMQLGGPSWTVLLGRRDSTASFPGQTSDLPPPTSSLQQLLSAYNKKNLNPTDMVALSGAYACMP
jgi:hypothetical protein